METFSTNSNTSGGWRDTFAGNATPPRWRRLGLLFYNLWHLFLRCSNRAHVETRRATLVPAVGPAGAKRRQKTLQVSDSGNGGSNCGPATSGCARGWPQRAAVETEGLTARSHANWNLRRKNTTLELGI